VNLRAVLALLLHAPGHGTRPGDTLKDLTVVQSPGAPTTRMFQKTAGAAASDAFAASSDVSRTILLTALDAADTGAYIEVGGDAGTTKYLLEPGRTITITTLERVSVIRAGAVDVVLHCITEVFS